MRSPVERNRITLSGGWARQLLGEPFERQTAPAVGLSYGYRPLRFLEVEAGVLVALHPGGQLCNAHACYDPFDRYLWVPFGVRFIAPLSAGRFELFGRRRRASTKLCNRRVRSLHRQQRRP